MTDQQAEAVDELPVEAVDDVADAPLAPTPEATDDTEDTEATDVSTAVTDEDDEPDADDLGAPSLAAALEAILLLADEPVDAVTLAQVVRRPEPDVAATLAGLAQEYAAEGRGFDLREVAGGWRYYTRDDCAAVIERFVLDGQQARLTQAALETLAVVAYRQPVSRARISAVRGVNVDGVVRTLVARGLIAETGTEPESGAILYRTTSYFLERLGLRGLEELPPLADHIPDLSALDDITDAATV